MTKKIVVIGSANMDVVIPVARLPEPGETITGGDLALHPGGKGANQACTAGRLGGRAAMIAQLGADPFATTLIESLESSGVDTSRVGRCGRATGCASIYVLPGGENSIVISPGANATLDPETALARLNDIEPGDFVLCQLEIPIAAVEAALARARSTGAITILDPAPAQPLQAGLLSNVDYLTPNQTEAATLLDRREPEPRSFEAAARVAAELLRLGPAFVVLKLGGLGCFVAGGGISAPVPAFRVEAIDSTAAGDVFNGALAVALAEGKKLMEAALFASAAAAISVTRRGAQSSIPYREEVEAFLVRERVLAS
jgi:ribokinase